ncbi:MAG: hypothetical protein MI922_10975, partial [Bacteroidales bacterium]|nr:hypothetical protein [Bacteroidales bacterium]
MKRILVITCCILSFYNSSLSQHYLNTIDSVYYIKDSTGHEVSIQFNSSYDWTTVIKDNWLKLNKESG